MINKKIIAGILCVALSCSLMTAAFVTGEFGTGTADILNADPVATVDILDTSWTTTGTVLPNNQFYFNVTVNDPDNPGDIQNVTLDIRYDTTAPADDPTIFYRFAYNNTNLEWYQMRPYTQDYIDEVASTITVINATAVNYSFALTLNKTALDTNGVSDWNTIARVLDYSNTLVSSPSRNFIMAPFVDAVLYGNAGGSDFYWSGAAESNQTAQFNTVVTSNDWFSLNTSYTGFFDAGVAAAPWGSPEMWVKQILQPTAVQIVNSTMFPNTNVTWYTSGAGPFFAYNRTHEIALVFPSGLTKGATYSGVTVWIYAYND